MKLMLDTQIAVWAVFDNPKLGAEAKDLILAADNQLFVSAVSLWEIAIKHKLPLRRDPMPFSAKQARMLFEAADYRILPITPEHAQAVDDLAPLHDDPFDQFIVAQAIAERIMLLTRDRQLAGYGGWVRVV